jgi:hypothetical protein
LERLEEIRGDKLKLNPVANHSKIAFEFRIFHKILQFFILKTKLFDAKMNVFAAKHSKICCGLKQS